MAILAESLNTRVDFHTRANSMNGGIGSKHGDILIGDRAFEFYNYRNPEDFIQIPWTEIERVRAQVYFKDKFIRGFFIDTYQNGSFNFIVKEAGKSLKAMSAYLAPEQLVKHKPVLSLKNLWKKEQ
ncbi:DUF956 family protein [Ignavigranum ruoffiae]|uniref:DUF956 family protein n=1 Tax=Ignavigranum ruoffiae TaxID=89093 RepID=UPI00207078D8|nr:DUF956 family protein [Ignavigranum ruoffiae]